ncbi:MAG: hypothetical protein C6H99_03840 [Epsilonproteobacteria bacterium]|nr:hypothetical protein [Campylobacterota bacterium]NPA64940.1 hypothetical protein [Campylobacterota bacterium]
MDLFALPPFYHEWLLLALVITALGALVPFLKKRSTKRKKAPTDIYELSLELQKRAPHDPKVLDLLKRLAPYKYQKDSKVPKALYKELLKYYKKTQKKRYNGINPLKRMGHEKVRSILDSLHLPFRKRL